MWFLFALVAVTAIACLVAFGGVALYKAIAYAKRLAKATSSGDGGSVTYALFDSPDARHYALPPVVRVQMIENRVRRFCAERVDGPRKRLERVSGRLSELHEARRSAELAVRFELATLARARDALFSRGIGTASVATQTPQPSSLAKKTRRVRFITPDLSYKRSIRLRRAAIANFLKLIARAKSVAMRIWTPIRWVTSNFEEPTASRKIAGKVADLCGKLLIVDVTVNENDNTTLLSFEVLPFIPQRRL